VTDNSTHDARRGAPALGADHPEQVAPLEQEAAFNGIQRRFVERVS